jgi:hypothetical protein
MGCGRDIAPEAPAFGMAGREFSQVRDPSIIYIHIYMVDLVWLIIIIIYLDYYYHLSWNSQQSETLVYFHGSLWLIEYDWLSLLIWFNLDYFVRLQRLTENSQTSPIIYVIHVLFIYIIHIIVIFYLRWLAGKSSGEPKIQRISLVNFLYNVKKVGTFENFCLRKASGA